MAWQGATLRRTSNLAGLTTGAAIAWSSAIRDTDSFWSAGAPTRITIPPGVAKVRLSGSLAFEALTVAGSVAAIPLKNGLVFAAPDMYASPFPRQGTTGFSSGNSGLLFTSVL